MRTTLPRTLVMVALLAVAVGCGSPTSPIPTAQSASPSPPASTPRAAPTATMPTTALAASPAPAGDPFALISRDDLLATLEDLTAIQPYSGWRNSATEGERQGLDYVAERLATYEHLAGLGMELGRQQFRVFMGTELWETRLHLTVGGQEVEVPADGLRGDRDDISLALRFDSDGTLNDAERNPVTVQGPVVLFRSAQEIRSQGRADLQGKVVFLDYAVIDRVLLGVQDAVEISSELMDREPAGLVLVTQFSNRPGESHGSFVADTGAPNRVRGVPAPPTLYVRLEDLAAAGISAWDDLGRIEAARLTWDADVFSPATSANLVARIPGSDPSRAVILGAHIDSPNSPGAMDDGSGSAVLLEVARVLDAARVQPAVDLYLVWFGSEELGLYGSYHFAATHQELLDRTLAMLQIDCLTRPLDGIDAYLTLVSWSYGLLGDDRLTWPDYLGQKLGPRGVETHSRNYYGIESDNSALAGFDVPNANLIYEGPEMDRYGVWYAGHIHDPYDTVELAREVGDTLEQMARVALAAALDTGREAPHLRTSRSPERRALFVASHTESVHMAPTAFTDLGMALAWEGYDVDMVPYGRPVTAADLDGAALVIALPVIDYPSPGWEVDLYDEAWSQEEIAALDAYVAEGGLLVLTNSANRLKYVNRVLDPNEDWGDTGLLAERFGITFQRGTLQASDARPNGESTLMAGIDSLTLAPGNGVPFSLAQGQVLAQTGGKAVVALVDYGQAGGQVLVLADVGILGSGEQGPQNLTFWQNLAEFAWSR